MTAKIRVEKADATPYQIMVQVQMLALEGIWHNVGSPTVLLMHEHFSEEYIHANKRVIVYEYTAGKSE